MTTILLSTAKTIKVFLFLLLVADYLSAAAQVPYGPGERVPCHQNGSLMIENFLGFTAQTKGTHCTVTINSHMNGVSSPLPGSMGLNTSVVRYFVAFYANVGMSKETALRNRTSISKQNDYHQFLAVKYCFDSHNTTIDDLFEKAIQT